MATPEAIKTLVYFLIAVLPTLVWLWFWLKEDEKNPEPNGPLVITFFAGGLIALLALPMESFASKLALGSMALIIIIAAIEEIVKFGIVALINFKARYMDERIDYPIYLITGAMGFAMMENVLFFFGTIFEQDLSFIFFTTNMRFLGATVLHGLMGAILGLVIGYGLYRFKSSGKRILTGVIGLGLVTGLHALFNYFIINESNTVLILTLGALWLIGIIVLFFFERARRNK